MITKLNILINGTVYQLIELSNQNYFADTKEKVNRYNARDESLILKLRVSIQ